MDAVGYALANGGKPTIDWKNYWTGTNAFCIGDQSNGIVVVGSTAYAVHRSSLSSLDLTSGVVTAKANLPNSSIYFGNTAVTDGTKIWVGASKGGYTYEYNISTNTWTVKAYNALFGGSGGQTAALVSGKIYYFGGGGNGYAPQAWNSMYDPATDTYTNKANIPAGRMFAASAVDSASKIHLFGGVGGTTVINEPNLGAGYGAGTNTHYVYDPVANTWVTSTALPVDLTRSYGVTIDGLPGFSHSGGMLLWDGTTWISVPLPGNGPAGYDSTRQTLPAQGMVAVGSSGYAVMSWIANYDNTFVVKNWYHSAGGRVSKMIDTAVLKAYLASK